MFNYYSLKVINLRSDKVIFSITGWLNYDISKANVLYVTQKINDKVIEHCIRLTEWVIFTFEERPLI